MPWLKCPDVPVTMVTVWLILNIINARMLMLLYDLWRWIKTILYYILYVFWKIVLCGKNSSFSKGVTLFTRFQYLNSHTKQLDLTLAFIYIRLIGEAINLCIYCCLAKVPGCEQCHKNVGWSLFQNGLQRAEIAISLIFVLFSEWIAWYK